ncbi:MAG: hypothetical protein IPJ71_18235 [Bdellovibrionales bacterium]|nr:hypothetical protein [Bdellovibrionales bacterium]
MNYLYSLLFLGFFLNSVAFLPSVQSHAEEAPFVEGAAQDCGTSFITQVAKTGDGHFVALTERLCRLISPESSPSPKNRIESVQLVVFDSDGKREKSWDVPSLFSGSGSSSKDQPKPLIQQIKIFSGSVANQFFITTNGGTRIYSANTEGVLESFYLDTPPNNEFFTLFGSHMMCHSTHYQIEELHSFRSPDSQVWLVGKGFAVGNDCLNTKTNKRVNEWREAVILSNSFMSSSENKGDDVILSKAPSSFSQVFILYPDEDNKEGARLFGGLGIDWPTTIPPTNPSPRFQTLVDDDGYVGILAVPADGSSYSNKLESRDRQCGKDGYFRDTRFRCKSEEEYQVGPNSLRQFFPLSLTVESGASYKLIKSSEVIEYLYATFFYSPRSVQFVHQHGLTSEGQWITAFVEKKEKSNISKGLNNNYYQLGTHIFLPYYPSRKNRRNLSILNYLLTASSRFSEDLHKSLDIDIFEDPSAVFVLLKTSDGPSDDYAPFNLELDINVASKPKHAGEKSESGSEENDDAGQETPQPVFEKMTSDFNLIRFNKTEQGLEVNRGFSTQLSQSLKGTMSRITAAAVGDDGVLFLAGISADGKKSVRLVKTK